MMTPKDYLGFENARNRANAALYVEIVKRAFGDGVKVSAGGDHRWDVLVGHHVLYEMDGDVETEGEIPSADTLMFDHDIMKAVFGDRAVSVMRELASVPVEARDALLKERFEALKAGHEVRGYDYASNW